MPCHPRDGNMKCWSSAKNTSPFSEKDFIVHCSCGRSVALIKYLLCHFSDTSLGPGKRVGGGGGRRADVNSSTGFSVMGMGCLGFIIPKVTRKGKKARLVLLRYTIISH